MTSTISWAAPVDGDFAEGSNWTGGEEPTKRQIADLPSFGQSTYTATFDTPPGGPNGNKYPRVRDLQVGSGVTLDILDPLNVGVYRPQDSGQHGGVVTNDGNIDLSGSGRLIAFGKFDNLGDLTIESIEGVYIGDSDASFINRGQVFLDGGEVSRSVVDRGIDNSGTISGVGGLFDEVVNRGLIESTMMTGNYSGIELGADVLNDGLLVATGGSDLEVDGAITGKGSVEINGGEFDLLEIAGGVFGENVNFGSNSSSTFELGAGFDEGNAIEFTGNISGFSTSGASTIFLGDMVGSGPAIAQYTGNKKDGVLSITGDGHTETFSLVGDYLNVTFSANMTRVGTTITANKTQLPSTGSMIQAMATLGSATVSMSHFTPKSREGHSIELLVFSAHGRRGIEF